MSTHEHARTLAALPKKSGDGIALSTDVPPPDSKLGQRVRWARLRAGIRTGTVLARKLGIEARTLYRWERGENQPHRNHIGQLAELLDVDVSWLEHGVGRPERNVHALSAVERYLRAAGASISSEVADSLRQLPYERLGLPDPTLEEVERARVALEMWLSDVRQRRGAA